MFESANGRSLAASMPRERVVPESDGPFAKLAGETVMPWSLHVTAKCLAELWELSVEDTEETLIANGKKLLTEMGVGGAQ
ncbi:TatD family hydrolase [Burkholderia cepacia]|uniref:TatD family hydrolase n=1 Tax=Burkholderia cepacia TaxID=292 RepID=UPI001FC811A3|nr:TatD family hydrolase [Burkholderia cepacia]